VRASGLLLRSARAPTIPNPSPLRATVVAGQRYADDFAVVWRGMSIGRIRKATARLN